MEQKNKKPILIFLGMFLVLLCIFFLFPINLFDGVIVYEEPHRSYEIETRLSLSYFIGMGYDLADMTYVKSFYLTSKGWFMAFLFVVGIPLLVAYRVWLGERKK